MLRASHSLITLSFPGPHFRNQMASMLHAALYDVYTFGE